MLLFSVYVLGCLPSALLRVRAIDARRNLPAPKTMALMVVSRFYACVLYANVDSGVRTETCDIESIIIVLRAAKWQGRDFHRTLYSEYSWCSARHDIRCSETRSL